MGYGAAKAATAIRQNLEAWAEANTTVLADTRPAMHDGGRDRPAEVWEALLAWPTTCCASLFLHNVGDGARGVLPLEPLHQLQHLGVGTRRQLAFGRDQRVEPACSPRPDPAVILIKSSAGWRWVQATTDS